MSMKTKFYVLTGTVREMILVDEGTSPREAAREAIARVLDFEDEVVIGDFTYVSEFGFGDDGALPEATLFLSSELDLESLPVFF